MKIKIILPICEVPLYAIVTKITGEKRYQVEDRISIYGDATFTVADGKQVRFLFPKEMSNAIIAAPYDYEVLWEVDEYELEKWLCKKHDKELKKVKK